MPSDPRVRPERSGWVILRETTEKFFAFYFASVFYFLQLCYNFLRVVIPLILNTIKWAIVTVIKMVLLFFAMILLIVGPRIGLPNAVYQSTWRVLVRTGAVTPSSISRIARRNRQQDHEDPTAPPAEPETPAELAGELILVGYERMDVMLAAQVVNDTVQDVVVELFWTAVDALGLGNYFRGVARYKAKLKHERQRRVSHPTDSDEEVEEVYSEAAGGWIRRGGSGRASPVEIEEEEEAEVDGTGAMLAMVLHRGEETAEWGLEATQRWWQQRKIASAERKRQKRLQESQRKVAEAENKRDKEQARLYSLEGQAAFCVRQVEQAERDVEYWQRETKESEKSYDKACSDLEVVRSGGTVGKEKGWFGGWGRSEQEQLQDEVNRLEIWLTETASELTKSLECAEQRKRDSVAMLAQMRVSERLLEKAEIKYREAAQSHKKVLRELYPEDCPDSPVPAREDVARASSSSSSGAGPGGGERWTLEEAALPVGEGPENGSRCVHRGVQPRGPASAVQE